MSASIQDLFFECRRTLVDGAYDKLYLWLRDARFPPQLLPPYQGLKEAERASCRAVFQSRYQDADQIGVDDLPVV